jgi:hypothetical protein
VLQGGRNGGQPAYGDGCCGVTVTVMGYLFSQRLLKENECVCLAGFAGVLGERRFGQPLEGLQASDTSALCWVYTGMLGERGLG